MDVCHEWKNRVSGHTALRYRADRSWRAADMDRYRGWFAKIRILADTGDRGIPAAEWATRPAPSGEIFHSRTPIQHA